MTEHLVLSKNSEGYMSKIKRGICVLSLSYFTNFNMANADEFVDFMVTPAPINVAVTKSSRNSDASPDDNDPAEDYSESLKQFKPPSANVNDFPGEKLDLLSGELSFIERDISIPGPRGMNLEVLRHYSAFGIKSALYRPMGHLWQLGVPRIKISKSDGPVGAGFPGPSCFGTDSLSVYYPDMAFSPMGVSNASYLPNGEAGGVLFSNNAHLTCDPTIPTLRLPDGKIIKFEEKARQYYNGTFTDVYYATKVSDRFGNYIQYAYETVTLTVRNRTVNVPLLKTMSNSEGVALNFEYQDIDSFPKVKQVKQGADVLVSYGYTDSHSLETVTDAVGRITTYASIIKEVPVTSVFSFYETVLESVTLPEGGNVTYGYETLSPDLDQYCSLTQRCAPCPLYYKTICHKQTVNTKIITGPGVVSKTTDYVRHYQQGILDVTSTEKKSAIVQRISNFSFNRVDDVEVNAISGEHAIDGRLTKHSISESGVKKYERVYDWKFRRLGSIGCDRLYRDADSYLKCGQAYLDDEQTTLYETDGDTTYSNVYSDYDEYAAVGKVSSTNSIMDNPTHYQKTSYLNNTTHWLIGLPLATSVNDVDVEDTYTTTHEIVYYDTTESENYAALVLPYEEKTFNVWNTRFTIYNGEGLVAKEEYNTLLSHQDATGNRFTEYSNYKLGQAQKVTRPGRYSSSNIFSTKVINDRGWIESETDLNDHTFTYTYDKIGRLATKTFPSDVDNTWQQYAYQWGINTSNYTTQTLSRCQWDVTAEDCVPDTKTYQKIYVRDGLNRLYQKYENDPVNNLNKYQNFRFDEDGKLEFRSYPSLISSESRGTHWEFDVLERLTETSIDAGGKITNTFLKDNKIKSSVFVSDTQSNDTTTSYLAYGSPTYGQMLNMVSEEKVTTIQSINVFGEVTAITQSGFKADGTTPISQTEYRAYDANHNLCKVTRSDVGSTVINNSVLGEVQWQAQGVTSASNTDCEATVAGTQKVEFDYDNLGNVWKIDYKDVATTNNPATPDVTYELDNNGNLKTLTAGSVSHSYNYNRLNLLKDETLTVDGKRFAQTATDKSLAYTYDSLGNLASLTYPDGDKVEFAPNAFGQATQAIRSARTGRLGQTYASGALYYPSGSIDTFIYGNDLSHKTELNTRLVPKSIKDSNTGVTALDYSYTYDNNLNVKSISDNLIPAYSLTSLTYDGLDRLKTTAGGSSIGSSTINYDGLSNITAYTNTGHLSAGKNRNLDYSYDLNNRLDEVQIPGSTPIKIRDMAYDDRGNVTDNSMLGFTYNRANQMVSASGGNKTFLYDGHNRRVRKTSVTADGTETSYSLYSQSGTLLYRETDKGGINYIYLGKKLIAKDGVIPETSSKQHYRPFGESIEGAIDDVGYTGHKFDADLGLSYMQARYYDPVIGRFYSNDPVDALSHLGRTGGIHGFNRYAYANNNPYKYIDPDGRETRQMVEAHHLDMDVVNGNMTASERLYISGAQVAGTAIGTVVAAGATACAASGACAAAVTATVSTQLAKPKLGSKGGAGAGKDFAEKTKDAARAESGDTCVFCGKTTIRSKTPHPDRSNIDHATSKKNGGNNTLDNAQNTCQTCNLDKGAKNTDEYLNSKK